MPQVEVLISTMDNGLQGVMENPALKDQSLRFLIIRQTDADKPGPHSPAANCRLLAYREKGLSRSRNRALENSIGDYCLLSDDDVGFPPDIGNLIRDAFEKNPEADIITFQVETPGGGLFKKYRETKHWHNRLTLGRVCSIEIAFRRKRVIEKQIRFDEDFGLGAKYATGEEFIFLNDCLAKGLRILYLPVHIARHSPESSGSHHDKTMCYYRGAMLARAYGILMGAVAAILFAIKKRDEYRKEIRTRDFLIWTLSGLKSHATGRTS